jgi:hypothetical protein
MLTDHTPVELPRPRTAYALLTSAAEIAIVFVHGYYGNAHSTWVDFQHLVDQPIGGSPVWGKSDLYFYDYGTNGQVQPLAEELRSFLRDMVLPGGALANAARPRSFLFPSGFSLQLPLATPSAYKRLVLVGHSAGAVLIRQLIVEELKSMESEDGELSPKISSSPIATASLRFFAPAHLGVLGAGLLGIGLNLQLLNVVASLLVHSNSLFKSLTPGGPVLQDLKSLTERYYEKYPIIPALKADSLFGHDDTVVIIGNYSHEKVHGTIPGQNHTSICKPTMLFTKPLEFVTDGLLAATTTK